MADADIASKVLTPSKFYRSPCDVLADASLSGDEKRRVLDAMRLDALRLSASAGENMSGGESGPSLQNVETVIARLKDWPLTPSSPWAVSARASPRVGRAAPSC